MKNYFTHFLCAVATVGFITFSGCGNQPAVQPANGCNTSNTLFNQLYTQEKNKPGNAEFVNSTGWDLEIHQYTFSVNSNQTICKVGYQGNAALFAANKPYKIEILTAAGAILYSGNHLFQSNAIDYQTITPVNISANQSYIIKRTAVGFTNLTQVLGTVVSSNVATYVFPINANGFKITQAGFAYVGGTMHNNVGIPKIDLVFQ